MPPAEHPVRTTRSVSMIAPTDIRRNEYLLDFIIEDFLKVCCDAKITKKYAIIKAKHGVDV